MAHFVLEIDLLKVFPVVDRKKSKLLLNSGFV